MKPFIPRLLRLLRRAPGLVPQALREIHEIRKLLQCEPHLLKPTPRHRRWRED